VGGPTPPAGTNYGGSIAETVTGNPNIIVTGNSGVNCGQTAATWTCTVEAGTLTPVVTVSGYQKNNNGENRYACIAGLTGTTVDTGFSAGSVASATFSLAGFAGGATYNLVIKTTPCS
jgi:hypothetical protein